MREQSSSNFKFIVQPCDLRNGAITQEVGLPIIPLRPKQQGIPFKSKNCFEVEREGVAK